MDDILDILHDILNDKPEILSLPNAKLIPTHEEGTIVEGEFTQNTLLKIMRLQTLIHNELKDKDLPDFKDVKMAHDATSPAEDIRHSMSDIRGLQTESLQNVEMLERVIVLLVRTTSSSEQNQHNVHYRVNLQYQVLRSKEQVRMNILD